MAQQQGLNWGEERGDRTGWRAIKPSKGLFYLILPGHSLVLREVRVGTVARIMQKDAYWLAPRLISGYLSCTSQYSQSRGDTAHSGRGLPHFSLTEKMLHRHFCRPHL